MFLFYVLSFFKKGDTIQGGTLFKRGHYLRKYGICSYLVTHIPRLLLRMVSFRVHVPTKWIYGPHRAKVPLLNVPTLFSFSQPPVAPSSTSETRREDFLQGLRKLMKNKSIILLVFAYALSQGVQEALLPVLNLDFEPLGIKEVMNPEITWPLFVILV